VEREYKVAIELNANYVRVHHYYAIYLRHMRRFDESLKESTKAQELDPTSATLKIAAAGTLYCAGHYDEAIEELNRASEFDANNPIAHYWMGRIYVQKAFYEGAITEFESTISVFGKSPELLAHLGYVYAVSGRREAAHKVLDELEELSSKEYVASYYRAIVYVGLDGKEQAFEWLEKAYQEHDLNLIALAVDPTLDRLREDPRFTRLLQLTGLIPRV
jgi:tetratricopeptide (TPR) repeat protein